MMPRRMVLLKKQYRILKELAKPWKPARQILGVTQDSSWEEIVHKYDNLFEFTFKQKVHRAKECLEEVYKPKEPETK